MFIVARKNSLGKRKMSGLGIREAKSSQGLELKIARLRAGLKQYQLASEVGIASTQLSEIETGRREVSPEVLERILGVIKSNKEAEEQT